MFNAGDSPTSTAKIKKKKKQIGHPQMIKKGKMYTLRGTDTQHLSPWTAFVRGCVIRSLGGQYKKWIQRCLCWFAVIYPKVKVIMHDTPIFHIALKLGGGHATSQRSVQTEMNSAP